MQASLYSMVLNSKIGLEIIVVTSRFTTKGRREMENIYISSTLLPCAYLPPLLSEVLIELIIRAATFLLSSLELQESVENEEMCVKYIEF